MAGVWGVHDREHHGHRVAADRRLRRHPGRGAGRGDVQSLLPDLAAPLSGVFCGQTLRADRHGNRRDRAGRGALGDLAARAKRHQRLFALGRRRAIRAPRQRSTASSSACWCPSACTTSGTCRSSSRWVPSPTPPARSCTATSRAFSPAIVPPASWPGAFLFKMFGLPAAAIAIWHSARPENRMAVGGIMMSAALTSFLTGITEPIEFSFLFVAPVLYFVHAILVGLGAIRANSLDMHMGFTFSQGGIDFVDVQRAGQERAELVAGAGARPGVCGDLLHRLRVAIRWFDLKTPGRADESRSEISGAASSAGSRAHELVAGLRRSREHRQPGCLHHAPARGRARSGARRPGRA